MFDSIMLAFITFSFFAVSLSLAFSFIVETWLNVNEWLFFSEEFSNAKDKEEPEDPTAGR